MSAEPAKADEAQSLRRTLVRLGHLGPGEKLELLGGGVSGIVALAHHRGGPFVVKAARRRLDVAGEWWADPIRTVREGVILERLAGGIGPAVAPAVRFIAVEERIIGIQAFLPIRKNWKEQLMQGQVDPRAGEVVAAAVAALHSMAPRDDLDQAEGSVLLEQLRLDPYFREVQRHHPTFAHPLDRLIQACLHPLSSTLVHGDITPKNVLVRGDEVVLLDYEVIHHGEPAFDIGMLLAHLLLKMTYHHDQMTHRALATLFQSCWTTYRSEGGPASEGLVVAFVGGFLLARVLGKSRVDYLNVIAQRRTIDVAAQALSGEVSVDELPQLMCAS